MSRLFSFALIAAVTLMTACSTSPPTIPKLTITNPTVYDVEVRAKGATHSEWILLGRVQRGQTSTTDQVDDLGPAWVFRFEYPGPVFGGELRETRDQLERDSWTVKVPDSVAQRLRAARVPPSQ